MSSIQRLAELNAVSRLRDRDSSLFSNDPVVQADVGNRLGWIDLAQRAPELENTLTRITTTAAEMNIESVVLLGMGGSSLASMVMASVFPEQRAKLYTLDTVSPVTVSAVLSRIDPATTLVLVSSKSGSTIEPNALYAVFRARFDDALGEDAGSRFIAITDPGSELEQLARDTGFGEIVAAPPTVGGRFSAMTTFGLVPAALMGLDLQHAIRAARDMEAECGSAPLERNPAAELATFIADAHSANRDKLTIVSSRLYASFGLWVEQLVAESTGKLGTGVVPIVELSAIAPDDYGPDRAVVVVRERGDEALAAWAQAQRGGIPVHEIIVDGTYGLFAEFVRWEWAVALVGVLLGVNPFDEPNVSEAKAKTAAVLESGTDEPDADFRFEGDVRVTFTGALSRPGHEERAVATAVGHAVESLREGDYIAVLAYLPDDSALLRPLAEAVASLSTYTGAAVAFELGPRYLHSTGQLHKGGPNSGIFIVVSNRDAADIEVPGQPWTLRQLHRAQAQGDLATLAAHDRRAVHIDLPDASPESVGAFAAALLDSVGVVRQG